VFELILFEPEIPPNTGNIIRVCANTGTILHLIHPLGFQLDDKKVRRAGLDYRDMANVKEHASLADCLTALPERRVYAFTTRGTRIFSEVEFQPGDIFMFGPETRGLPPAVLGALPPEQQLRIPMLPESRSMNLSNSAAVVVYEAWRQQGYAGGG
jgi:tRNA (cytidine/uridine-2'-O-)-methyltransferase